MVLDSLLPVFALILLGHLLKRWGLTGDLFLATSDRLVYFIFFPALLFWKIGAAAPRGGAGGRFYLAVLLALGVVYALSLLYIRWRVGAFQAGTFSQACYRFNTYIGMAIVINAFGAEGARTFGVLIAVLIPVINLLAVSTLVWYGDAAVAPRRRLGLTLRALAANPLILACLAGLLYSRTVGAFPVFVDNLLGLAASVTLPLALLSIGGALSLAHVRGCLPQALAAAGFKLVLLPLVGWGLLQWLEIGGLPRQVAMVFFALPTSTAIYVLSSQLRSDTRLASAAVVVSTAGSLASLSVVLTVF